MDSRLPANPAQSPPNQLTHSIQYPFSFSGSGSEYFLIWLTNTALTILTLGIYGAWAKVRREQYFHSHTFLDDVSFEYTANPISILKGRLLLFAFVFIFAISNSVFPLLGVLFIFLAFFAFPWVITQALKFRARYTSYRNIPFGFVGSYGLSFKYFILTRIIGSISFGSLMPWAKQREKKYVVSGMRYGRTSFTFRGAVWDFYKAYIGIILFAVIPVIVMIGLLAWQAIATIFNLAILQGFQQNPEQAGEQLIQSLVAGGSWIYLLAAFFIFIAAQIIIPIILKTLIARVTWSSSSVGSFEVSYTIPLIGFLWIASTNLILRVLTLGLAAPFCAVRMYSFKINNLSVWGTESFGSFKAAHQEELKALGDEVSDMYDLDIDLGF